MSSASLLQLLATQARLSDGELAERLDMTEEAVRAQREQWEKEGVILGYQAVVNEEYEHDSKVAAFIEVKMTPERDGGFDRLAMRISRFDEVSSCYLASGGFDLLVLVEGKSMREIARFVAEKLSTLEGVLSTSTHFHLKTYKKNGCVFEAPVQKPLIFLETRVEKQDAAMIDGLLEAFFSISQHMAQERQKHCLCWWDKKTDGWNFYSVENVVQLEEVYAHVFQSMFFSRGNATIDSFEKERKEQFSEVIYITEYWKEKDAVFDDWNLTLLLERREARKEEGEALVPYIFSAETMGEDIDRILTAYRSVDYGA